MVGLAAQRIRFEKIVPGERIQLRGEIAIPFDREPYFEEASFTRERTLVNQVPVATESRSQIVTETYARTYTTMYAISEPLLDNAMTISALVVVVVVAVATVMLTKKKRKS
jgi:hypothetical protein